MSERKLPNFFGTFLILVGFIILVLIYAPVLVQEIKYQTQKKSWQQFQLIDDPVEAATIQEDFELEWQPTVLIPQDFNFSLVIPRIGVNAQVFPEVDSGNPQEYLPILNQGVAHAQGSALPDQSGPVFIFAHSTDSFYKVTRYNAAFFLLRKLDPGDEAFVFYENRKYHYQVAEKKVVAPDKVTEEVQNLTGNWLVLQTCHPPGTTFQRLLVVARLID